MKIMLILFTVHTEEALTVGALNMSSVKLLLVDDVDEVTSSIPNMALLRTVVRSLPVTSQFVAITSFLPIETQKNLGELRRDIHTITSRHFLAGSSVQHRFVSVRDAGDKEAVLKSMLYL